MDFKSREFTKYIMSQNRGVWKGNARVQRIVSFREMLREFWNNKRLSASPQNNWLFRLCENRLDNGNIVLMFDGHQHPTSRIYEGG